MFDVQEFMADKACEPFPFKDIDGQVWELPHVGLLTADDAAKLLAGDYESVAGLPEGVIEALKLVPVLAVQPLVRQWLEHCGMELDEDGNPTGKFLNASPSSPSTAPRSRPTSRSGASKTRKR